MLQLTHPFESRESFADFVVTQQILDLFPIEESPNLHETNHVVPTSLSEHLGRVQSGLKVQKPVSANDEQYIATINRPGACYTRWQSEGDLSANERAFVTKTGRHPVPLPDIFFKYNILTYIG